MKTIMERDWTYIGLDDKKWHTFIRKPKEGWSPEKWSSPDVRYVLNSGKIKILKPQS